MHTAFAPFSDRRAFFVPSLQLLDESVGGTDRVRRREAEQRGEARRCEARQCVALRNGDERLRAIGVSVASDTGACRSAQARQSPLSDSSCEALLNARVGRTLTL